MSNVLLSLNFMHCMERFATQIYLTQRGAFKGLPLSQNLTHASENEKGHVQKLQSEIKRIKGKVYPFGWLFQFAGVMLGLLTRLSSKRNILKADTFVETRAVKDYNSFLKSIPFDSNTCETIRLIIADEENHITNWKKARESFLAR